MTIPTAICDAGRTCVVSRPKFRLAALSLGWIMEVLLTENQESRLNELALRTGRGTDELVQEAVTRLLARNEWFEQQVQAGKDQVARGEFIEEEEMDARVERMLDF